MTMVKNLIHDIEMHCAGFSYEILLTSNIIEDEFDISTSTAPVRIIKNTKVKGFGANHNQAFALSCGEYFCVMNPDIRLLNNPFPSLISATLMYQLAVCGPRVINELGENEECARCYPSPWSLLVKAFSDHKIPDYSSKSSVLFPDWIGGMFMLIPAAIYQSIRGFDERFFLYYEDVDICRRLYLQDHRVGCLTTECVVHAAQRTSHRDWRYFLIHIQSISRFFFSRRYLSLILKKFTATRVWQR